MRTSGTILGVDQKPMGIGGRQSSRATNGQGQGVRGLVVDSREVMDL